jgi:hypothetical protein
LSQPKTTQGLDGFGWRWHAITIMTARMQITLDPAIQTRVRRKAESIGVPVAEYVRRVIAKDLGGEPPKADVSELFDLGASEQHTDIATGKKRMIAEAIAAKKSAS